MAETNTAAPPALIGPWWHALPEGVQRELGQHIEWLNYRTGQTLLRADRLPHQVMVLIEGQVRLLSDAIHNDVVTLTKLEPGASLGWPGLVRREPCETAIATEPCLVAAIPAPRFVHLWRNSQALQEVCCQPHPAELAAVLLPWLQEQPQRINDPIALINQLLQTAAEVISIQPFAPQEANPRQISLASGNTGRMLLLNREAMGRLIANANNSAANTNDPSRQPAAAAVDPSLIKAAKDNVVARQADALPAPQTAEELGWPAEAAPVGANLPLQRAEGELDTAIACLQRLARQLHFPLPRDTVYEVLDDCQTRQGQITLLHIGQLLEGLGLDVRPLHSAAGKLHRISGTGVLQRGSSFVLLVHTDAKGCWLADPERGISHISTAELEELFPDGLELILVRRGLSQSGDEEASRFDLAWFWSSMRPYRFQMLLVLCSGGVSKALELVFPLACLQIIDAVVGGQNGDLLAPITIVLAVAIVAMALLGWLRQWLLTDLADRIDTRLGSQVISHLFRLPMRFFDRRTVGDLASRLHDLQRVRQFITETGTNTVIDMLFIPVLLIVIFLLSPLVSLIILAEIPIILAISALSGPLAKRQLSRRNIAWGNTQGLLVEVISAIKTVKTQNFATQARWRWLDLYQRYTGEDFKLSLNRTLVKESTSFVERTAKATLFLVAASLALQNKISVGSVFGVYILSSGITNPLINLSRVVDQYREARAAMDGVADVLGQIPEESSDTALDLPMPRIEGAIRFENVTFSYGLMNEPQLDGFDLELEAGTFVGLVGLSGSGKSTVVQLLDGLYPANGGRVFVDGIDISKVQISSLRRQVGFVPQESILFDGTVLDNIRLNTPDAAYETITQACKIACAHEFIMNLPNGYNSRVGERGGGLSGGQKQRLAIARMVLQNPSLIILDEATSALDANSETNVMRNLRNHFSGKTMLFVTHRLGNLRHADRILVMDRGRLIEDGRWEELLAQQGSFATLARQQHELS